MENEEKDYGKINLECLTRILIRLSNLTCICEFSEIENLKDLVDMSINVSHEIGLLQGLVGDTSDDVPLDFEDEEDEDYEYDE